MPTPEGTGEEVEEMNMGEDINNGISTIYGSETVVTFN